MLDKNAGTLPGKRANRPPLRSYQQTRPLQYQALEPRQLLAVALTGDSPSVWIPDRTHFASVPDLDQPHSIVANYRDDFSKTEGQRSLDLYWNAPDNWSSEGVDERLQVGESSFRQLVAVGDRFQAGNQLDKANWPANYLSLHALGGHVGAHANARNSMDRFAIVSLEVDHSGYYSVIDSWIRKNRMAGDQVEVRVWVENDTVSKVVTTEPGPQYSADFDVNLGFLKKGERVFVAVGAGENHVADGFHWDFSIARFEGTVVADYQDDFGDAERGWSYYWNAPARWAVTFPAVPREVLGNGEVGDISSYRHLLPSEHRMTPDGNSFGGDRFPAGYLRLTRGGGMVGLAASESNEVDRFAIAAIEIPDSGYYSLTDTLIQRTSLLGNGIELVIHDAEGTVLYRDLIQAGETDSFDSNLGFLKKGDSIYVGVGANGDHLADPFLLDFSLVAEPMLRSGPVRELDTRHAIHVEDFGARPDDQVDDQEAIQNAIDAAIRLQRRVKRPVRIQLDAGTYRLSVADGINLTVARAADLVFEGAGQDRTELLFTHHRSTGFRITDSENLIFRDFSIDYEELAFTQGKIEEVVDDNTLRIQVDPGYRAPNDPHLFADGLTSHRTQFLTADRSGRLVNNEKFVLADLDSIIEVSNGVYEVSYRKTLPVGLADGDAWYQIARINEHSNFTVFRNEGFITVSNVTSYAGPSGFVQGQDNNQINVLDVRVDLKEGRLVSVLGDAVHGSRNRTGVWVEGSTFVGLSDDIVNVYRLGQDYVAEQLAPNQFSLVSEFDLHPGERIVFYRPDGYREEARIVSVTGRELVTDRAILGFDSGTRLAPLDHSTAGSVIRDNVVQRHRAGHGSIVVWSPNTTVLANQFEGINTHAISTNAYEAVTLSDGLVVQGNRFDDIGFSSFLETTSWAAIELGHNTHRNIVTDNLFGQLFGSAIEDDSLGTYLANNLDFDGVAAEVNQKRPVTDMLGNPFAAGESDG